MGRAASKGFHIPRDGSCRESKIMHIGNRVAVEKLHCSTTRTSLESAREERVSRKCAEMWLRSAVLTCNGMCTDERFPTWQALYLKITCFWRRMIKSRALCLICQPVTTREMTSDQAPTFQPCNETRGTGKSCSIIRCCPRCHHQNSDGQPRQGIVRRAVDGTVQRDSR